MNDTRAVFDALLKDIEHLQSDTEKLLESKAVEELETHLTDRIAMLSENNLEVISTQRESMQSLSEQIDELANKTNEIY